MTTFRWAWPTVELGNLASFRNGLNYSKANFGKGLKVINVADFGDRSIPDYNSLDEICPDGIFREESLLKVNDILFVRSNGNRELIGRSMMLKGTPPFPLSHSAFTIRARFTSDEALPQFFAYVFRSHLIRSVLSAQGNGANISNLNQDILSRLAVPLPSLAIQTRIASTLSLYDDLIENNTRRINLLHEMARRIYEEWFVHFRFPGHEQVEMVGSELGLIPEGWKTTTLGAVSQYINRGLTPKYDDQAEGLVINQKCIRGQKLSYELARRQSKPIPADKRVRYGDVLINSTGVGTLGRVAQVLDDRPNCTVDTHVTIARPGIQVKTHFYGLALYAREQHFEQQGVGATGQTELGRVRVAETTLILPPAGLQEQFDEMVAPMRSLAVTLGAKNANLRTTRDLLLPKLISGELDVSNMPAPEEAIAA
jgi:type I restriction enzyme S subunit